MARVLLKGMAPVKVEAHKSTQGREEQVGTGVGRSAALVAAGLESCESLNETRVAAAAERGGGGSRQHGAAAQIGMAAGVWETG